MHQDGEAEIPRWKLHKADWQTFQEINETKCVEILSRDITDVEKMNSAVVAPIIQPAEETISKSKGNNKGKSVMWWDESYRIVVKRRNKAFRQVKAYYTLETLVRYKRVLSRGGQGRRRGG